MTQPELYDVGMFLRDERLNSDIAWHDYSVEWTATTSNPTIGNGYLNGRYKYDDTETVSVAIVCQPGSTTSFGSGQYQFSLPVNAAQTADPFLQGIALLNSALYTFVGWVNTASGAQSRVSVYRANINSQENLASWTPTAPVTFANGHSFYLYGRYRYVSL